VQSTERPPPDEEFRRWYTIGWRDFSTAAYGMGGLPLALMLFVPRTCLSFFVVGLAMVARAVARLVQTASSYERKANLRILIITDYMPPQTHGIAIRFRHYIDYMRRAGHEVQVFCTNTVRETESSFDHPNLPSIVNPYNVKNKMAYSAGVKLAWYLGAKQWDLVHLVCPSNIAWPVLPVCAWRSIPIYASHHVDMKYYVYEYVKMRALANFGWFMYRLVTMVPTAYLAQVNAAPTLTFLNSHLLHIKGARKRIPSGVAHERFMVDSPEQLHQERRQLLERCGMAADGAEACVILMVQRLAPEKGTMRCLAALSEVPRRGDAPLTVDGSRPIHVVIAGDGPSRKHLESFATTHRLPVTFVGNVPNASLPPLYRAADVFVTCSTSETYGLTCLEALSCGTPAAMPHCDVFDELWTDRVPPEWIYDETSKGALVASIRHAGSTDAKPWLAAHPVKASWQDATHELLAQYEEAIEANLPARQALASYISILDQLMRAALLTFGTWWLMRAYTGKILKMVLYIIEDLASP